MESRALPVALQRFVEQFATVDETVTVVLKGHLLIEEALDGIISTFVFHREPLGEARLSFAQKLQLARAISLREHENSMWQIGTAINSLRNELAHSLDSPKRARKIQAVLKAYRRENQDNPKALKMGELPEAQAVLMVCAFFLGFLTTFRDEVDRFRKLVRTLDAVMNRPKAAVSTNGAT